MEPLGSQGWDVGLRDIKVPLGGGVYRTGIVSPAPEFAFKNNAGEEVR